MPALRALRVENFRSLERVEVVLGPLNVLIGANGAGKSNLLEVIDFLGDLARLDLSPAIAEHGGWDSIFFRGTPKKGAKSEVRIGVEAQVTRYASDNARDIYDLRFSAAVGGIERKEDIRFKRTKGQGRRITISGQSFSVTDDRANARAERRALSATSSGLATLQRLGDKEGAPQVREIAALFETFRVFDPNITLARRPSGEARSSDLRADASNLAAFLRWLSEDHPDTFDLLQDDLRAILPGLRAIRFESIGGATDGTRLLLQEAPLRGRTDLAHASFGTVRALAILAMLHDPNPPKLSCIEEIDHGFHPYALDRIVDRLRIASQRTQLLLASHSPTFVNRLKPDEVIICERDPETGASRIPALTQEDVERIMDADELGLGELWFTGTLGGVP